MKQMSVEEFNAALQSNEHGQQYLELINKVRSENRGLKKEQGYEIHHIHPKALGGKDRDKNNTVKFTITEHLIAHILLAQTIKCAETLFPVQCLFNTKSIELAEQLVEKAVELRKEAYSIISDSQTNTTYVYSIDSDSRERIRVPKTELQDYLDRGHTQEKTINVHKGLEHRIVLKRDLELFLQKGYLPGAPKGTRTVAEETRKKYSEANRGKTYVYDLEGNCFTAKKGTLDEMLSRGFVQKRKIFINDGVRNRKIFLEELNYCVEQGWYKGKLPLSAETKHKLSESHKGHTGYWKGKSRK